MLHLYGDSFSFTLYLTAGSQSAPSANHSILILQKTLLRIVFLNETMEMLGSIPVTTDYCKVFETSGSKNV